MKQGWKSSFGNGSVTLREATAVPYASMGWRLNGGHENLIVLATDTAGQRLWTSAAHVVIQTQDGRILRTVGLPHDLTALVPAKGELQPVSQSLSGPFSQQREADFADLGAYGMTLTCRTQRRGPQAIVVLGKVLRTVRVDEICTSASLHWTFTDNYWVDPDNMFVWKSTQHIHPGGDVIDTEILRPPE